MRNGGWCRHQPPLSRFRYAKLARSLTFFAGAGFPPKHRCIAGFPVRFRPRHRCPGRFRSGSSPSSCDVGSAPFQAVTEANFDKALSRFPAPSCDFAFFPLPKLRGPPDCRLESGFGLGFRRCLALLPLACPAFLTCAFDPCGYPPHPEGGSALELSSFPGLSPASGRPLLATSAS